MEDAHAQLRHHAHHGIDRAPALSVPAARLRA